MDEVGLKAFGLMILAVFIGVILAMLFSDLVTINATSNTGSSSSGG